MSVKQARMAVASEPAPDWWDGHFAARQRRVRTRIAAVLETRRKADRAWVSITTLHAAMSQFDQAEVVHALAVLERDGAIEWVQRREPVHAYYPARGMTVRTYWRATGGSDGVDLPAS